MLKCPLCAKSFSAGYVLKNHIFSHTKEKPHKCLTCSATFPNVANLNTHTKLIHDGPKINNIQCPECSSKFSDKRKLKAHLVKHSADFPFSCSSLGCSFKTKRKGSLARHLHSVHSLNALYKCKFVGCDYKTSQVGNYYRHLKIHSNERPFACKVPGCNYTCKTKDCLRIHTSGVHIAKKPWKCSICDFQTKQRSSLKNHQFTHSSTKRFHCQAPNCRYASNNNIGLVHHFDRKHRKKEILCTEPRCNYRCGSTVLLKIHLRDHKLTILKCPVDSCVYSTRLINNLRTHVSRHHGDNQSVSLSGSRKPSPANAGPHAPAETQHCPFPNCDYQSEFPHRYNRHIMTHENREQRKYSCKLCSVRFAVLRDLESHIQRHLGERSYSCSHCDYTAVDGGILRRHAQRVHQIFVIPCGNEHQYKRECRTCNLTISSYSEFMLHSMTHLKPVVLLERLHVRVP